MPTYPYKCKNCSFAFEKYQSFSERSLTTCPECGDHSLVKVFSQVGGVQFKGSGFYSTDASKTTNSNSTGGSASGANE